VLGRRAHAPVAIVIAPSIAAAAAVVESAGVTGRILFLLDLAQDCPRLLARVGTGSCGSGQ